MILTTGAAGFIGSNFANKAYAERPISTVCVDALTYAGNADNLSSLLDRDDSFFVRGDVTDQSLLESLFQKHQPEAVVHFAAESHVDRSIHHAEAFIQTNIVGTFRLLEAARQYWSGLPADRRKAFRFVHVSTDEVYGTLGSDDPPFTETTPYAPNSPYAASKAASDHLVRSYNTTHGLPTIITNCSNNYGPFQFPEKLIPLVIHRALEGKSLPIYGDGQQVRAWLYVEDHVEALLRVLEGGTPGEVYNIGGWNEQTNLSVVHTICDELDGIHPRPDGVSYREQITFVKDRPGHDRRYAIDAGKIERELGWRPKESFESGLRKTIQWYLDNPEWVERVTSGAYRDWVTAHYGTTHG